MTRRRGALVWAVMLLAGGLYSLALGQDMNGDQRNNHVYQVWRLFHHQQDIAWGVGGPAGYVPANWDIPWYFAALHLPTPLVVFLLGVLYSVAAVLAAWIVWSLLREVQPRPRAVVSACAGALSVWSPAYLAEFGTTYGNVVTAIPVLVAVLLVVRRPDADLGLGRALLVGALLGAAFGLKVSNGVWVVAGLVALLVIGARSVAGLRAFLLAAGGATLGAALTGGPWFLFMQRRFDNPLFPFYNAVFHSPYGPDANVKDENYAVHGWGEALRMPFRMARSGGYPSELTGRDDRWVVLLVVLVVALVAAAGRRGWTDRWIRTTDRSFVLAFVALGFLLWDVVFGVARYAASVELLSGAALVCLTDLVAASVRVRVWLIAAASLLIVPWVVVPRFVHISPWHERWYDFAVPPLARQSDLLVVFPTREAASYVLPALPSDVRAVQVPTIYLPGTYAPGAVGREDSEVRSEIERHHGPLVSITSDGATDQAGSQAGRYGFTLRRSGCAHLMTGYESFLVCPWDPAGAAS